MAKKYAVFFLKWILFLYLLFFIGRWLFVAYNFSLINGKTSFWNVLQSFYYGFKLDISAISYLSVPILAGGLLFGWTGTLIKIRKGMFRFYAFALILLMGLLFLTDCELYQNWGTKISQQFFIYITFPKEAMAASGSAPYLKIILFYLAFCGAMYYVFRKLFNSLEWSQFPYEKNYLKVSAGIPVALLLLVLGARGGLGTVPINQSSAYFSSKNIDNNIALNSFWNFFDNLLSKSNGINVKKYQITTSDNAHLVYSDYFQSTPTDSIWLNNQKPNVVFILLESFSSDLVNSLTNRISYTPELEALSKEGLWFTDFYGSGDRTDKGLSAVLSGYPALPITSIVTEPQKASKIAGLSSVFASKGYTTGFYYGGDADFANMKAYLLNSGISKFIDKSSFPANRMNSKWGAYDGDVFDRFVSEHKGVTQPFFDVLLTLSSHEPFEVPYKMRVPLSEKVAPFKNSVLYADSCLGAFFRAVKNEPWYSNTLFILCADHGKDMQLYPEFRHPGKFRIPCLFMGGALKESLKGKKFEQTACQTDLAATLLGQLGYDSKEFPWSRNMASKSYKPFAIYSFYDGFGFFSKKDGFIYDNNVNKVVYKEGKVSDTMIVNGRSIQQYLIENYLSF